MADKEPAGTFARIPLDDLTLSEAGSLVEDPSWWDETLGPILATFPQVGVDGYWHLTVKEHRLLFEWCVKSGVVKNGDQP